MTLRARHFALVSALHLGTALAADSPASYAEASTVWSSSKDKAGYHQYAQDFAQFNNHFQLDSRGGCYQVGSGAVNLMLLITHAAPSEFARVERVYSDSESKRAQCFVRAYQGVQTKIPPFVPFVLKLRMQ